MFVVAGPLGEKLDLFSPFAFNNQEILITSLQNQVLLKRSFKTVSQQEKFDTLSGNIDNFKI